MNYKFINTEYLEMVASGDNELLKELISMFRDQVAEFNSEMILLNNDKNFEALGKLAHKANSSVAIMGMYNLADMLKEFEIEAANGKNIEKYESYISRFEIETKGALEELDSLVKNLE